MTAPSRRTPGALMGTSCGIRTSVLGLRRGTYRVPWESQSRNKHPLPVRRHRDSLSRRPEVTSGLEGVNGAKASPLPERVRERSWAQWGTWHRGFRPQVCEAGETRSGAHSQCVFIPGFPALHTHLVLTSTQQARAAPPVSWTP